MENVLILKGNDKRETNKIAVASYLQKWRKRKFAPEPQEMNSESEIESHPLSDSETSEFDMEY